MAKCVVLVLMCLTLTACGGAGGSNSAPGGGGEELPASINTYHLEANYTPSTSTRVNGVVTLTETVSLKFPATIQTNFNYNGARQAYLTLGAYQCLYVALDGEGDYIRKDGLCNWDVTQAVPLVAGQQLILESHYSEFNLYTDILATITQ